MTDRGNADRYTDRRVFPQFIGYAEVLLLPAERALVSTWLGRCFVIDLKSGTSSAEPEARPPNLRLPIGDCLRSLTVSDSSPPTCAVASRAAWASVWQLGAQASVQVYPMNGSSVNAIALSPQGDRLTLGTGYYPLTPDAESKAVVELRDTTDLRACRAVRRLPGVAVDRLAWDATGTRLLATTGAITQDRGYVVLLDGHTLALLDIAELDSCFCLALHLNTSTCITILVFRNGLEVRDAENLALREHFWGLDEEVYGADFTIDGGEALLTNGQRINLWSEQSWKWPALPDCTGVAIRSGGGGLGISRDGILRVWGE